MPSVEVSSEPLNIVQWLVDATKIEKSRRQAREDITNGAIRINGEKIQDVDYEINPQTSSMANLSLFVAERKSIF